MLNVFWAGVFLVGAKLAAYVAESRYGFLPELAVELEIPLDLGEGGSPVFAVLLVGLVFIAIGVFTNSKSLILMPIVLCAAEVSVLSPMLGVRGIPAIASFGQVQILSTALAVIGALVLMDSNNVYRLRDGRIGVALRLMFALEIANVGAYAFFTLPANLGIPLGAVANVACFGIILWISERADARRAVVDQVWADAKLTSDLKKQVEAITKNRDEWKDACEKARKERGELKLENASLQGELKAYRAPELPAPALAKAA